MNDKLGRLRLDTLDSITADLEAGKGIPRVKGTFTKKKRKKKKKKRFVHMEARFAGKCIKCNKKFPVKARIIYDTDMKLCTHEECGEGAV